MSAGTLKIATPHKSGMECLSSVISGRETSEPPRGQPACLDPLHWPVVKSPELPILKNMRNSLLMNAE